MMIHPTIATLRRLRLTGMAKALEEQQGLPDCDRLGCDERLADQRPGGFLSVRPFVIVEHVTDGGLDFGSQVRGAV